MQHRREWIVECGRDGSEDECRDHRRRHKLPCGNAGGARNDEFMAARQCQITGHRANQNRERHDAFGELGDAVHGDFREQPGRGVGPVCATPHQLDVIDHGGEGDDADE